MEKEKSFWFEITKQDQYNTVNELMEESNDKVTYYLLLILSSIIIASGILLANSAILIGGMLITPLLSPVLLVALGITTGNPGLIQRSVYKIGKSVGLVMGISLITAFIFGIPTEETEFFNSAIFMNDFNSAFLYFLVAFASGIAATYAWVRKKVDNMLPGIAIAVSLVPPVAMVGAFIGTGDILYARYYLMIFLFNIIGIIGGAMILFSLFRFYNSRRIVEKNLDKVIEEEQKLEEKKKEEAIKLAEESITIEENEEVNEA
jgi:uncharacterized hydrophobic protein (TIGR00271 family)